MLALRMDSIMTCWKTTLLIRILALLWGCLMTWAVITCEYVDAATAAAVLRRVVLFEMP